VSTPGLGTRPYGIPERRGLGAAVQRQLEGARALLLDVDDTDRPLASVRGLDEVTDGPTSRFGRAGGDR
jgi:hypothetical protein